jgi:hypothetical protein
MGSLLCLLPSIHTDHSVELDKSEGEKPLGVSVFA